MESIGLMPSSTGQPGGMRTGEKVGDYAMEGGPFLRSTERLLTQDFIVSWLDRFPLMLSVAAAAPILILPILQDAITPPTATPAGIGLLLAAPSPGNHSNRVKYRCPSCAAQVWGKPGHAVRGPGMQPGQAGAMCLSIRPRAWHSHIWHASSTELLKYQCLSKINHPISVISHGFPSISSADRG